MVSENLVKMRSACPKKREILKELEDCEEMTYSVAAAEAKLNAERSDQLARGQMQYDSPDGAASDDDGLEIIASDQEHTNASSAAGVFKLTELELRVALASQAEYITLPTNFMDPAEDSLSDEDIRQDLGNVDVQISNDRETIEKLRKELEQAKLQLSNVREELQTQTAAKDLELSNAADEFNAMKAKLSALVLSSRCDRRLIAITLRADAKEELRVHAVAGDLELSNAADDVNAMKDDVHAIKAKFSALVPSTRCDRRLIATTLQAQAFHERIRAQDIQQCLSRYIAVHAASSIQTFGHVVLAAQHDRFVQQSKQSAQRAILHLMREVGQLRQSHSEVQHSLSAAIQQQNEGILTTKLAIEQRNEAWSEVDAMEREAIARAIATSVSVLKKERDADVKALALKECFSRKPRAACLRLRTARFCGLLNVARGSLCLLV